MDFAPTEEQDAIFELARAFADDRIAPHARDWEAAGEIPRALWPDLAALGFGGLYVREDAGGAGLSRLDGVLVFEALSGACASVAAFLSIHNMCAAMIDRFGSDEMRGRVLPGRRGDGDGAVLLPDRARIGVGRRGIEDPRRTEE